jgi:hypothetical protein
MGGVARSELVEAVTEAGAYGFLDMLRDARSDRTANRCGSTDPGLLKAELSLRDMCSFQMRVIAGEPFLAFYLTFCVSVSPIDLPFS